MSGQSDDSSGFSALSRAFKANPTLEYYVKLRRENPNEEIEVAISGSIEWLFANEEVYCAHCNERCIAMKPGGASPIQIIDATFTPREANGTLQYDPQKQRVTFAQEVFDVVGSVKTQMLGQAIELQMTERQRIEIRILDQQPELQ